MRLFKGEPVQVKRQTHQGVYISGKWTQSTSPSTITIQATVQPEDATKLDTQLQGRRVHAIHKIFSDVPLLMTDQKTKIAGDLVVIDGHDCEVISCQYMRNNVIPHYESLAIREKEGTNV